MRITHITFSDENMTESAFLCRESALKNGADISIMYNKSCYSDEFKRMNEDVLNKERGAGYWLWKPYIIEKKLSQLSDNDVLVYTDAGVEIVNRLQIIIEKLDSDVWLFGNNYRHLDWCKMNVMDFVLPDWMFNYYEDSRQVQASVIIIRNTLSARLFIREWLKLCQINGFIDDSENNVQNDVHFIEHRHDQAILTCLAYKYGIKLHWWPAHYNDGQFIYDKHPQFKDDDYPVIFHHHRKRNNEW
jgi:hypothetical protein